MRVALAAEYLLVGTVAVAALEVLFRLNSLVGAKVRGALITEAALTSNLTLVTADRRLAKVGRSFGAHVEEIP